MLPVIMQRSITVPGEQGGARLDIVLSGVLEGWSRSRVQRAIKDGAVSVDGEVVSRPSAGVAAGAEIRIQADDGREVSTDVRGARIVDLVVLFEDEHIAVIDKPAGLVTHPNPRQLSGTVSDLAVARFGPLPEVQGANRPGIVHRLDRLTSGVLILGKTQAALEHLKGQFKDRTVEKTYHAVVHGTPRFDTEWLTGAVEASPASPDRMRVVPSRLEEAKVEGGDARPAETFIERLEDLPGATLLAAHPKTGRTHQIRVHLQAAGLPIVGDRVYGPKGGIKSPMPKTAPKLERPALHARRLCINHPLTGERMTFEAEVPADMARLLDFLRSYSA